MSISHSDLRAIVAFYGCQISHDRLERLYDGLLSWFDALHAHPGKLGIRGEGFTGKVGAFRTNDSRLRKAGFAKVEGLSLYCLKPGGEVPLWDWQVSAEVVAQGAICTIGASPSHAALPGDALRMASEIAIKALTPKYGIGFRREMRLGPSLYATGLVQGLQPWGEERLEADRIAAWKMGNRNKVYEHGILRDLYPWNFLTDLQHGREIEGKSLKHWIEAHPEFGTLSALADLMLLWEVQDSALSRVRTTLQNAGLLFDAATSAPR